MEILARKKAENEKVSLLQCLDQMQARMDQLEQRMEQERTNVETMSQHGSNSRTQGLMKLMMRDSMKIKVSKSMLLQITIL
uniref:Uncharacterized protein n=1 Tax=Arundo donax TaxID=35708 RepID=A0A0A9B1Y9_ARUDO